MINLLKKILGTEKWIVGFMVIILYASTIILVLLGSFKLFINCKVIFTQIMNFKEIDISLISSYFLSIIDTYLLALVFYMFAVGIYKLFIGEHELISWLRIKTIEDLKKKTASMIILFLVTLFVQKVALWTDFINLLYTGIAIALVCAVLIWYCYMLQEKK